MKALVVAGVACVGVHALVCAGVYLLHRLEVELENMEIDFFEDDL